MDYLTECFRRNLSESGFSSDKRITGYTKERIDFKSQTSEKVFMAFNRMCMEQDLFGRKTVAIDGTKVSRNGTCTRTLENGIVFRVQKYICTVCRYTFVARPPNYGYGKHFPDDISEKGKGHRFKDKDISQEDCRSFQDNRKRDRDCVKIIENSSAE